MIVTGMSPFLGRIARLGAIFLSFVVAAPALAAERQPAAPYYSVQLMSLSSAAAAREALRAVKDQPFARVEQRDNAYVVRLGVFPMPEPARVERDAWRTKGMANARVVKVSRAVDWALPDGGTLAAATAATAEPTPVAAPAPTPAADAPAPAPVGAVPAPAAALDAPALVVENAGGATNWQATLVSLERMGYTDGFALEGSQGTRRLFLPLPAGVSVSRAQLTLDLAFGELLIPVSAVQFRVNDVLRRAIRRGTGGPLQRVEIPLTARDLEQDFVEIEMDYSLWVSEDICLSRKLAGAYATLSPGSGLAVISGDVLPRSVRAAWSLLPREVTVAARLSELTPAEFQALFRIATLLHRNGHAVRLEALGSEPTRAHVVVAPAERYVTGGTALDGSANLRVIRSRGPARPDGSREQRAFILVDATRPLPAADLLAAPWRHTASGSLIDAATAVAWPQPHSADSVTRLKDLGFDDAERVFNFSTQWELALPFGPLGDARRASRIVLDVYGPRVSDVRGPTFVSAYYNGRLVHSAALKQEGAKETLDFELPRVQLRARNNLKIVAQRDEAADDCKLSQAAYPLSVSPESIVETRALTETPATFAELVPHQRALELYMAKDALASADKVVPMLVALGEHFWPDVPAPEVRLFDPGADVRPTGSFFVIGDAKWDPRAWVRFDEGRVRVRSNATGDPLMVLDFASDVPTTVLQMVEAGGHGGAWLRATGGYANVPSKRTLFEDENVAFLDARGVQAGLRVGSTRDYRVDYPDAKGWFSATGAWRTALFVVAWVTVLGLLIYLYRRTRRHREG